MTHNLQFFQDLKDLHFVFIIGSSRVGKTTLGTFLAQHPQIEFLDEPWEILMFPFLCSTSNSLRDQMISFFKTMLFELATEMMLYRRANMRFLDASSIWKSKSSQHIYQRLLEKSSRALIQEKNKEQKTIILLALPETTPFIQFFFSCIPNLHIIHMTRNGFDVANEITNKRWFSDEQLKTPKNSQPYHPFEYQSENYYLPWWVSPKDSESFLAMSDIERGLWYWHYFYSSVEHQKQLLTLSEQKKIIDIDSQLLFDNASGLCMRLLEFINADQTNLALNFVKPPNTSKQKASTISWASKISSEKRLIIQNSLNNYQLRTETTC